MNVTAARDDPNGYLALTADLPEPGGETESHEVLIPWAAIGARMARYGLTNPGEAVAAILREHHNRLDPNTASAQTADELAAVATDASVVVRYHASLDALLSAHGAEIDAAYDARRPSDE